MAKNAHSPPESHSQTELTLFVETDALYDDMLSAIASARERVWLETYIFSADTLGWQFAEALIESARARVDVRLRVDSAGALQSPYSKRIRRHLAKGGVDVRWFNRLRRFLPSRLNRRDHRKLLMVDNACVYVGSSNITWSNSRRLCGDSCTHQIDARIDGTLARRMTEYGTALWQGSTDQGEPGWQAVSDSGTQFVASSPAGRYQPIRTLYHALFEQAETSAYLASGFFVPDEDMVATVEQAARRGVDVRLILARHTDMKFTRWAAHALYARLLDAGVRIYEYLPSILHVKAAVTDSSWATLGSGNFDNRSFFLNYELNLETRDPALCRQLHETLLGDLARCEEITAEGWAKRSWLLRAREKLVWPLRGHL